MGLDNDINISTFLEYIVIIIITNTQTNKKQNVLYSILLFYSMFITEILVLSCGASQNDDYIM